MAVYLITDPSPKNTARDMSVNQDFSFTFQGDKGTDYQVIIMNNSTSAVLYDSGKVNLGTSYWYNGETKSVTVPSGSVANDLELKWTIQTWDGTSTNSSLEEIFFNSYENPTLSLTVPATITEQSYEFEPTWTQTEGLSIKKFEAFLYDSSLNIIQQSGVVESSNVTYEFEGFIDGTNYGVSFIGYDEFDRTADTGTQSFLADYSPANVNISPTVTINDDVGAINIEWGEAKIINGVETGVLTYTDDFVFVGDVALNIPSGGNLYYDVDIPQEFTVEMTLELPSSFTGVIATMDAGGYDFGYNGTNFYVLIGGVYKTILFTTIANKKWYVGLKPTSVYIAEII